MIAEAHTRLATVLLALSIAGGCASNEAESSAPSGPPVLLLPPPIPHADAPAPARASATYPAVWAHFLAEYLKREPVEATALGNHEHDGEWPDLSAQARQDEQRAFDAIGKKLAAIPKGDIAPGDRLDAEVLANEIARLDMQLSELKPEENDPR
jgi:hypothetical protein